MSKKPILLDLPMPIKTARLVLRPVMPGDGKAVNESAQESFDQFKQWLPWVAPMPTIDQSEETMRRFYAKFILREEVHLAVLHQDQMIGMGSFLFNWEFPRASIGYWCRYSAQGKGYITEAVAAMVLYAFQQIGIKRLTILCDDENHASAAIPERLGFVLEKKAMGLVEVPHCDDLRMGRCYVRFDAKGLEAYQASW